MYSPHDKQLVDVNIVVVANINRVNVGTMI